MEVETIILLSEEGTRNVQMSCSSVPQDHFVAYLHHAYQKDLTLTLEEDVMLKSGNKTQRGKSRRKLNRRQNKIEGDNSRHRYIQRLKQVIAAGSSKQNNAETDRKMESKHQRYQLRTTELIWLELQSWLNDRSIIDQDQILYNARQFLVKDVLSLLDDFRSQENSAELISLMHNRINLVMGRVPDTQHDCDHLLPFDVRQKQSKQLSFSAQTRDDKVQIVDERLELEHLSTDSSFSFLKVSSEIYTLLQCQTLKQVENLLKLLCIIESLYPSSAMLAHEFPSYSSDQFQCKVNALCCWYNITLDLQRSFSSLVHILSQCLPSSNSNLTQEGIMGDLENGSSVRDISELLATYVIRALKQKSVKSILQSLIARHFTTLLRAKVTVMPTNCYESLSSQTRDSGERSEQQQNAQLVQSDKGEDPVSPDKCRIRLKRIEMRLLTERLRSLIEKIGHVLYLPDTRVLNGRCVGIVEEDTPALSTAKDDSLFGLPSIKPLYLFFSSIFIEIMRHCMQQRMKQAMPFFENCRSSACLITAKQLVMESKEMLECAFLARDITKFLVDDVCIHDDNSEAIQAYEEDLHGMVATYLDFVKIWLVRMQRDLPHVPRGFQDTLGQEWLFVCNMASHLDFDAVVLNCSCFIKISADIVGLTEDFLFAATNELLRTQSKRFSSENLGESAYHDQKGHVPYMSNLNGEDTPSRVQAGVLWFHRQRSESPHLSGNSSIKLAGSMVTADTAVDVTGCIVGGSSSNSSSDPWINFQRTSDLGFQKRYLFEVCRAVRDLFNETRERSTRIISFAKQLRKKLEPGVAYKILKKKTSTSSVPGCVYCSLMELLHSSGYATIDFEDSFNWEMGDDYCKLHDFWIMVPSISQSRYQETETSQSGELWSLVMRFLLSHVKKVPNSPVMKKKQNLQHDCLIFIKKPCQRLKSSAALKHQRKKHVKKNTFFEEKQLEQSKNYIFHVDDECLGYNCFSKKVFGKHCTMDLKLICQNFEFTNDITVVASSTEDVGAIRKEFTILFSDIAKLAVAQIPIVKEIRIVFDALRMKVLRLCEALMNCIECSLNCLEAQNEKILQQPVSKSGITDVDPKWQVISEVNEVMQSCFNFAFDLIREATRIMSGDFRSSASEKHVKLATQWMDYVLKYREKGNGRRPRWASQGLTFICSLDASFWMEMSEEKFDHLKRKIDTFIQHLIGDAHPNAEAKSVPTMKCRDAQSAGSLEIPRSEVQVLRSLSNSSSSDMNAPCSRIIADDNLLKASTNNYSEESLSPIERVRVEIEEMEELINRKRMEAGIIGRVSHTPKKNPIINLGVRTVNFKWQRGAKVGEGAFGRVYTCVNVDSGCILAMKEVKFHPNDHQKIRSAVDEYTNFEGIKHHNLVQYYGVELHRDEMYIFMEYCDGGTLGDICRINLPEPMVRKYTAQLLVAVHALHAHGIVHRDIKGSNVFLNSTGTIKLGDFGSAIKLKDVSKTTPGEMVSQIGTTLPYSAPEVINSSEKLGYGRASDIWSLGCVVIEMSSGKQPWQELEKFQVMFRIGSGERPPVPESLSAEGINFVRLCTVTDPANRWTAEQLLGHTFIKVLVYEE